MSLNLIEPELEVEQISHRAVSGVMILTLRKFALKAVSYLGSIFWPDCCCRKFSAFLPLSVLLLTFLLFSDVGLGAALIQKRPPDSQRFGRYFYPPANFSRYGCYHHLSFCPLV